MYSDGEDEEKRPQTAKELKEAKRKQKLEDHEARYKYVFYHWGVLTAEEMAGFLQCCPKTVYNIIKEVKQREGRTMERVYMPIDAIPLKRRRVR